MDEEEPIATLGLSQEQETAGKEKSCEGKKDSENYYGERSISSSEESLFLDFQNIFLLFLIMSHNKKMFML